MAAPSYAYDILAVFVLVMTASSITLCIWVKFRSKDGHSSHSNLEAGLVPLPVDERTPLRPMLHITHRIPPILNIVPRAAIPRRSPVYPTPTDSSVSSSPRSSYFALSTDQSSIQSDPDHSPKQQYTPLTPPESPLSSSSKRSQGYFSPPIPTTDPNSHLNLSLLCLLHCSDLFDYFSSGEYQTETIESKKHRAVIDGFASAAACLRRTASPWHFNLALDFSPFRFLFPLSDGPKSRHQNSAKVIEHLLRSLHVSLNDGEWNADQPTYIKAPIVFDGFPLAAELIKHVEHIENMQAIQEDSIVRDLFEGLMCFTSQCMVCDETSVSFKTFTTITLRPKANSSTLAELLIEFEQVTYPHSTSTRSCSNCKAQRSTINRRRLWRLPSVLVFSLKRRGSHLLDPHPELLSYPITGLDMASHSGTDPMASYAPALASESLYDLCAVREKYSFSRTVKSYGAYVKDPDSPEWHRFIGNDVFPVDEAQDLVNPNADLLFYQRRR